MSNRNGNTIMTNRMNTSSSNNNNTNMMNAFNNEYQELNRIKTSMKNTARGLQLNANTLQTLIMRIENIASSNATNRPNPPPSRLSRKNYLKIQRTVHPNKTFPKVNATISDKELRARIKRNLTNISAHFQMR